MVFGGRIGINRLVSADIKVSWGIGVFFDDNGDISLIGDQIIDIIKLCCGARCLGRPRGIVGTVARMPELGSRMVSV